MKGGGARLLSRALVVAMTCAAVASCSSDDSSDPGGSDETTDAGSSSASDPGSGSASPTDSLLVPAGVELTAQGTALDVGDTATVAYEVRQGIVGVLDIKVTRMEKTSFADSFVGWDLSAETKQTKPYFVRATLKNRGETDLGDRAVPLYIVDGNNTLVEATSFASTFKPCSPGSFPKAFPTGASVQACLVFLAPDKGDLTAVSFRPTQDDEPITWAGELKQPKDDKGKNKGKGKNDKGKNKNGKGKNKGDKKG